MSDKCLGIVAARPKRPRTERRLRTPCADHPLSSRSPRRHPPTDPRPSPTPTIPVAGHGSGSINPEAHRTGPSPRPPQGVRLRERVSIQADCRRRGSHRTPSEETSIHPWRSWWRRPLRRRRRHRNPPRVAGPLHHRVASPGVCRGASTTHTVRFPPKGAKHADTHGRQPGRAR
jgi:hypothetical protein